MSEDGSREKAAAFDWKWLVGLAFAIVVPTTGTFYGISTAFTKLQTAAELNQKTNEEAQQRAADDLRVFQIKASEDLRVFQTQNKESLEAAIKDSQARFEALTMRIGNQDVLINNITTMTTRLDERLSGMASTNAQITARRDQQMDAILDTLERSRQDEMTSRERQARIEAKLDAIMRGNPDADDTAAPRWKQP